MILKQDAIDNNINIIDTNNTLTNAKQDLIAQIKALLPNVINSDNQLDIKALNDLLGLANTTSNNQGYELTFAGKGLARAKADTATCKELKIEATQSKNFDTTDNVIIRGDNIDTLKILYKNYHNKIKMIYIDPPYNTKSENFVYNDNFKQSEAELIESFGLNEDTCNFLGNVYGTRSHSGWLSFMYPRLILTKELLSDDGVIFISIDDHEQANLKIICDEIFGEENTECLVWNKEAEGSSGTLKQVLRFKNIHEYVLVCYKNKDAIKLHKISEPLEGRETEFATANLAVNEDSVKEGHKNWLEITSPTGKKWFKHWKFDNDEIKRLLDENLIYWGGDNNKQPRLIIPYDDRRKVYLQSIINKGSTTIGRKDFEDLMQPDIFSYPKPLILINTFLQIQSNDLILDFFAGSGTTAHAVMQLNAEDGGNRKFILCQLDEKINKEKSKPAYDFCLENNFEPVISSITIERVNRAGEKIKAANPDKPIDIGYKVFSLTEKPRVHYDETKQSSFYFTHERENATDTLINMLVATCKSLETKIEMIKENAIYKAANEIYVINAIKADELKPFKDLKINIDAFANIDLSDYLNLDLNFRENMTVIY